MTQTILSTLLTPATEPNQIKFEKLWHNYPNPKEFPTLPDIEHPKTIWQHIGGHVAINNRNGTFKNSCAIRAYLRH
jgi:hypothetical protein